jgi:hypothetical protein
MGHRFFTKSFSVVPLTVLATPYGQISPPNQKALVGRNLGIVAYRCVLLLRVVDTLTIRIRSGDRTALATVKNTEVWGRTCLTRRGRCNGVVSRETRMRPRSVCND